MDPLSITSASLALLTAVAKTSQGITTFIRGCRDARADLASISGELTQLQIVLELLRDDTDVSDDRILPESLQNQILSIIKNCTAVLDNIDEVLQKHAGKTGAAKWVMFGKTEVAGLRMSLEAHRGSLSLALEVVSVSLSKAIKEDITAVRTDVHDIKQDTSQIMAELTRLRDIVADGNIPSATRGQNYMLQQYLDSLTSYAESVCNDVVWDADKSLHVPTPGASPRPSPKPSPRSSRENLYHSKGTARSQPRGTTTQPPTQPSDESDGLLQPSPAVDVVLESAQEARRNNSTAGQASTVATGPTFAAEPGSPQLEHSDVSSSEIDNSVSLSPPATNSPSLTPIEPPSIALRPPGAVPGINKHAESQASRNLALPFRILSPTLDDPSVAFASSVSTFAVPLPSTNMEQLETELTTETAADNQIVPPREKSWITILRAMAPPVTTESQPASSSREGAEFRRQLVIIGDPAIGKTSLLHIFTDGTFSEFVTPTIFETYAADVEVDGKHLKLALWESSCDADRFRLLSYRNSHVIMICFEIDSPDSLDNVREKWIDEVRHHCRTVPFILVGLQKDLRNDPRRLQELGEFRQHPVTWEEGCAISQKIGASGYYETSAKTNEGVREAFEAAIRLAVMPPRRKRHSRFRSLFGITQKRVRKPSHRLNYKTSS